MTSRREPPVKNVDLMGAYKRVGNVPACAMHVQQVREAPLRAITPVAPCDCAFRGERTGDDTGDEGLRLVGGVPVHPSGRSFGYCRAALSTSSVGFRGAHRLPCAPYRSEVRESGGAKAR